MSSNLEQLAQGTLNSAGVQRVICLRKLLAAVKRARPDELAAVENTLPQLAALLSDPDSDTTALHTLDLFRYIHINPEALNRLIQLQRKQPNPLLIKAFGMSDSAAWNHDGHLMIAEALALDETSAVAAEVMFRHSLAINVELTIQSLETLALHHQTHVRSSAISKLISHTEGAHGTMACQCLKNILLTVDYVLRSEIAAKLAWSHRRGLTLLAITATDEHPDVRIASAKALWYGYRIRGRRLLVALSMDSDPLVRTAARRAIA